MEDCQELLKAEDVRRHVSAVFLRIFAKFVLLNAKQEEKALFMILAQFDEILQNCTFLWHFRPIPPRKLSVEQFGCAKEFAFRRSETAW